MTDKTVPQSGHVVPAIFTFISVLMLLLVVFAYVGAARVALRRRR